MTTNANTETATAEVTIVSIWSKIEGLEGKLRGRDQNVTYLVEVPVGDSAEATLENAFHLTNMDDRPLGQKACSTTSGDIMVLDGRHYLVEPCGFREITFDESTKIQALTSRDTSFGYDFMVEHGRI